MWAKPLKVESGASFTANSPALVARQQQQQNQVPKQRTYNVIAVAKPKVHQLQATGSNVAVITEQPQRPVRPSEVHWPCGNEKTSYMDFERNSIQKNMQLLIASASVWSASRAQEIIKAILVARCWDNRVTPLQFLVNELLVHCCGVPLALATKAVEAEWSDKHSSFQHALTESKERVFAFLKPS
jgi:hypothetical protein